MSQQAPPQRTEGSSSQTQTQTIVPVPVLHLRSENARTDLKTKLKKKSKARVRWTEDVVDNENMNKKKTKICCIFHPQREFGEESECLSDSSSDSSDSSGDEKETHDKCCEGKGNAYETQPHYKNQSTLPKNAI